MSRPKQKGKVSSGSPASVKPVSAVTEQYFLPLVIAVTFIAFFPSLQNQFVNLDDPQYVLENPVIKSISAENIKTIFTEQFVGNYQPLTMLSYMLDFEFFGLHPFGFHFINLILHLLSTVLVFLIISRIAPNKWIAFLTSLLFGIHPLHVESVAWVAERKDVLYGFFFLWALYLYVSVPRAGAKSLTPLRAGAILLLFACSVLSKAQAVVLPVVFLGVDFLNGRKFDRNLIMEKIPFFVLAFIFGFLAIKVQGKAGAMQTFQYFPFYERILFSCYALMTYLHKIILPVNLSCFYPYPETNDKINTVWVYISPAVLLALAFIVWRYFRKEKVMLFGLFFFLATIALVLQLLPIGDALYADRYTYLPSVGLFFAAAHYFVRYSGIQQNIEKITFPVAMAGACLLCLCGLTFQRSKVWHDSIALYTNALDNGYKAAILYNNRGKVLADSGDNAAALKDFNALVELKPRYPNGWRNKGLVHERLGQKEEAIRAYSEEIKNHPEDTKNYLSRGTLLREKNDFEGAIRDFSKMIELEPNSGEGYYARAEAYGRSGKLDKALADINKSIAFSPGNAQAYNNRGIIFSMSGKYQDAVNDFTKSLQIKPDNVGAYTNRALAYKGMGKCAEALQDMLTAKEKGISVDENEINNLKKLSGR